MVDAADLMESVKVLVVQCRCVLFSIGNTCRVKVELYAIAYPPHSDEGQ